MLGLLIAIVVVAWVARFVLKKYPAQPVLFTAGIVMMVLTLVFGLGEILPAKQSTGSPWLDIIQSISLAFSSRAAKLGMIIMLIGGFSKYMDSIGASTALPRHVHQLRLRLRALAHGDHVSGTGALRRQPYCRLRRYRDHFRSRLGPRWCRQYLCR